MKRNTLKKLGIIITSAMLVTTSVLAPSTAMTVYAEEREFTEDWGTIAAGENYDNNTASNVTNKGTIGTNEGTVDTNDGTIETNATGAYVTTNNETIGTNANGGYVIDNNGTMGTNEGTVTDNNGTIGTSAGNVDTNCGGATIKNNYGVVGTNNGTIDNNYGIVETNQGTIENNYTTTVDGTGIVEVGTVTNQWYEVKLVNNTTELRITSNGEIKAKDNNTTTDVFAKEASAITIHSTNPNKIIDEVTGDVEYVKNEDGSITINAIKKAYSLITKLVDKIIEHIPAPEPSKNDDVNKEEPAIEVPIENLAPEELVVSDTQTQETTPAEDINVSSIVAENPEAAIQAAKSLQNDPAVVAQAQELTVQMEAVTATYKESAVKELAAVPNQAVVGTAEYEAKQTAIVSELTNQIESLNNLTVQSLAAMQKVGVSVATGGCTKLETANVTLLNELLEKGVPVTLTYAVNGAPVTIKIPTNVNLKLFIGADGRLDLTKLSAYIVR